MRSRSSLFVTPYPERSGWMGALVLLSCLGCGDNLGPCKGVCTAESWTNLELLAGQPGGCGFVDGTPLVVHFDSPSEVTGDGAGHLYVVEDTTIRRIELSTGRVSAFVGTFAVAGASDGAADSASFNGPTGIVATPTMLYVADTENHTIRAIDVASKLTTTIAGLASSQGDNDDVGTAARFNEPEGLALANGHLYIADTDNNTIRVMDLATGAVSTLAGVAQANGTADGVGDMARFDRPAGMVLDGSQDLYVIDRSNLSVRHVNVTTAEVSTVATFESEPRGLAIVAGQLFVSIADGRVFAVDLSTSTMTFVAGASFMPGFIDGTGTDARFVNLAGLYADGTGSILLADSGACALRSLGAADHVVTTRWGAISEGTADGVGAAARFAVPEGVVVAPTGTIYVADTKNHTVREIDPASGLVTTIAGAAGELGAADGIGSDARFFNPSGLALDDAGMLYIADTGNQAIRQLDPTTRVVTTLGVQPATSDDSFTSFRVPRGLAVAGATLFVTDSQNDTVLAIDLATRKIHTLAGTPGVKGASDGLGRHASFYAPLGIVADGRDHVYVADVLNNTIRVIRVSTGEVTTLAGKPTFSGARDGAGSDARFHFPSYLAMNGLGDLFVSDTANKTVRHVDVVSGAVTTVIGDPAHSGVMLGMLPAQLGAPWAISLTVNGELIVVSESSLLRAR